VAADADTVTTIINHLDIRLNAQDAKRTRGFEQLSTKLDRITESTNAGFLAAAIKVSAIETKLEEHMSHDNDRFGRIDGASARADGWWKTAAAAVLAGFVGWCARHFGSD